MREAERSSSEASQKLHALSTSSQSVHRSYFTRVQLLLDQLLAFQKLQAETRECLRKECDSKESLDRVLQVLETFCQQLQVGFRKNSRKEKKSYPSIEDRIRGLSSDLVDSTVLLRSELSHEEIDSQIVDTLLTIDQLLEDLTEKTENQAFIVAYISYHTRTLASLWRCKDIGDDTVDFKAIVGSFRDLDSRDADEFMVSESFLFIISSALIEL